MSLCEAPRVYRVRCSKCRARRNLSQHPEAYIRRPRCRRCGAVGTLKIDAYRDSGQERRKAPTCNCDGWWFPHRRGSGGCIHRPTLEDLPQLLDAVEQEESQQPPF